MKAGIKWHLVVNDKYIWQMAATVLLMAFRIRNREVLIVDSYEISYNYDEKRKYMEMTLVSGV